jgi:hypothetical protein
MGKRSFEIPRNEVLERKIGLLSATEEFLYAAKW